VKWIRLSIIALVLAGGLALIFQQFRSPTYKNLPPTATGDWIAFGDSLTAGYGAQEGNDYPRLLGNKLGISIQNLGVPGDTTEGAANRVDQALALQPRVVLMCLGGNDGLNSVPAEQMFRNLGLIIDRFHAGGSFVVLVGVHSASLRDKNSSGFEQLAKEKEVFYIPDILDGVLGHPDLMSDYIHPNDAGYRVIAERLGKELLPLLTQIDGK
jgi:acyl-CoA thioesterase I